MSKIYMGTMHILSMMLFIASAHADQHIQHPCDGAEYERQAKSLTEIFDADQSDRKDFAHWTEKQAMEVVKRDRVWRKKVAELFAQGCLKSTDDYYHAATVFQHGEVPDHFFQTFIWASKAFKAGKEDAGTMAANGADRYLMKLGFKQLFGGQAVTEKTGKGFERDCFCL